MPKKVRTLRRVTTPADVEALLTRIETAMFDPDREGLEAAVQRLVELSDESPLPAETLTRQLMDGTAKVPLIAFNLLETAAGDEYPVYLQRISDDRDVADLTRFAAQRRYGWPERGAAKLRRAFLETLEDADGTLVSALQVASAFPLPDAEVLEEVLGYLTAMPSDQRRRALSRIVEEVGRPALRLLHALLHVNDQATQRQVLTQLVAWREPASLGPVERIAATARTKGVKSEADKALTRLRLRDVTGGANGVDLGQPLPPVSGAFVSQLDGEGGQAVVVIHQLTDGVFSFSNFFHNEEFGIKDVFGKQTLPGELVEEMMDDFQYTEIELIEVDLAAVRGTLALAAQVNAARKKAIPPVYEIWEPLLHESEPPPIDEEVITPELDDAPYAGRDDLLAESDELLDHVWFAAWGFPYEEIFPRMIQTPIPSRGHLTDRQIQPLIDQFMTPDFCVTLRSRLRRQAWLLDQGEDTIERDQALAVAASLVAASPDALLRNRFVRKLVRRSVETAAAMFYWGE
jgi:hypothetical protein